MANDRAIGALAVARQIHVARGAERSLLAEIERRRSSVRHPDDQKAAATDVAGLRVHDRESEVRCDRGIDGIATSANHFGAYFARDPVGGRYHSSCAVRGRDAAARKCPPRAHTLFDGSSSGGSRVEWRRVAGDKAETPDDRGWQESVEAPATRQNPSLVRLALGNLRGGSFSVDDTKKRYRHADKQQDQDENRYKGSGPFVYTRII